MKVYDHISPTFHEVADARLLLHVRHASIFEGHNKINIKTVDSYVVVIAMYAFSMLDKVEELWIEYGIGRHFQYLPIYLMHEKLSPGLSNLLPFFHAFTGAENVLSFAGIGKTTAWKTCGFREVDVVAFGEFLNMAHTQFIS
ncbi:unnamed protein product [Ceutorhynchus assimilis]|uniref:Uncharacterized protein n=1 Tax=Ceutorhynchus assimilis TaxID=467358 RepID=A0A9N9MQB8_9CUCU|nr:unnamed protein product [Ceutorhynchus assimilis]